MYIKNNLLEPESHPETWRSSSNRTWTTTVAFSPQPLQLSYSEVRKHSQSTHPEGNWQYTASIQEDESYIKFAWQESSNQRREKRWRSFENARISWSSPRMLFIGLFRASLNLEDFPSLKKLLFCKEFLYGKFRHQRVSYHNAQPDLAKVSGCNRAAYWIAKVSVLSSIALSREREMLQINVPAIELPSLLKAKPSDANDPNSGKIDHSRKSMLMK